MDDEPRLTPEAHDALYLYKKTAGQTAIKAQFYPECGDAGLADYRRGWNDCRDIILKALGERR